MAKHETIPVPLSYYSKLKSFKDLQTYNSWLSNGFVNISLCEPSLGVPNLSSLVQSNSSYYFLLANQAQYPFQSRVFTGKDSLFIKNKNLSYANSNPTYSFDVSGDFHSTSAFFNVLSTNNFKGNSLTFNGFSSVQINSDLKLNANSFLNFLSANNIVVTRLSTLSSEFYYFNVPTISSNNVFSSINYLVTAGGYLSSSNLYSNNVNVNFVSAINSFIGDLSTNNFYNLNNINILNDLSANYIFAPIKVDNSSGVFYQNNTLTLNTNLSGTYYFGVKPSDIYATDDVSVNRSFNGNWAGSNGSIIDTYPVLKPYFRNIKQVFDYIKINNLYGNDLNILIYDDIIQDNINTNSTRSSTGCLYSGNIKTSYYAASSLPSFMQNNGFKSGDYIWYNDSTTDQNGKVSYWGVDGLNFKNLNICGMYEIGSVINSNSKKQYTHYKPFNYSPRKISFNTYICSNPNLSQGNFGSDYTNWNKLNTNKNSKIINRQIYFNGGEMDVNLQNLCFEFNCNNNDSTCLYFKSGNSYLSNITIAALGNANYAHGAILAWPQSNVYVCGINQIDPVLLSPANWNSWGTYVPDSNELTYYPGYGLAIVGNSTTGSIPTLFSDSFINAWRSKIFINDYHVNRKIGKNSYLNSSIILDGYFTSGSLYGINEHGKIIANNHNFITSNFTLSNYNANIYTNSTYNSEYYNVYSSNNRDNFYFFDFKGSFGIFEPNYYPISYWTFSATATITQLENDRNYIYGNLGYSVNQKYLFQLNYVDALGSVFTSYRNSLKPSLPANDESKVYYYTDPSQLPLYDLSGIYTLVSPVNNSYSYTLNYYSSEGQTIKPQN